MTAGGLLSGKTNMMGASGWHPTGVGSYHHFEITNIQPYSHGFEATAKVYFRDKVESLYLRTDSSADNITDVSMGYPLPGTSSMGFRLPGTGPDDSPKKESVDPKRRRPRPGKGTGKEQGPAGLID